LTLTNDQIAGYLDQLEKEARALKEEAIRICWWMRGSITLDESVMLSHTEKEMINRLIKENLETTKKSGMPFF
jgi:hypothetical protein